MPRRILLLITDLEIGGTPTVVRELALRLNNPPEVEVGVACLKGWGPTADRIREAGLEVTAFDLTRVWQFPVGVRRLRELVRQRKIDTIVSFLVHANAVAATAVHDLRGVRLFQSVQTTQRWPRWHWWIQGRIERAAEKIIVPSTSVEGALRQWSGVPGGRTIVIHNAIDADAFERHPVFAGDEVRVGFLGRLDLVKRLHIAISAVAKLNDFPAGMMIFGDGPARTVFQHYQRLYAPDPQGGRFQWRGKVATPQEAMKQIDVLVLPSKGEGFGLVLIEAMASGVPVIASAAGGVLDVVRHEHDGLLVPIDHDEVKGFADAIRRLKNDAALRQRLIENGLATVRERFSWQRVLQRYRDILHLSPLPPGED